MPQTAGVRRLVVRDDEIFIILFLCLANPVRHSRIFNALQHAHTRTELLAKLLAKCVRVCVCVYMRVR